MKKRYLKCSFGVRHDAAPKHPVNIGNHVEYICKKCGLPVIRVIGFVATNTSEYDALLEYFKNKNKK